MKALAEDSLLGLYRWNVSRITSCIAKLLCSWRDRPVQRYPSGSYYYEAHEINQTHRAPVVAQVAKDLVWKIRDSLLHHLSSGGSKLRPYAPANGINAEFFYLGDLKATRNFASGWILEHFHNRKRALNWWRNSNDIPGCCWLLID